jgi:uncharacterized membrane protein YbhN (UPF0104 family)
VMLFMIGAYNVWLILNGLYPMPFLTFLRTYSYSWATSLVTPGQAGDVSMILFMRKHGVAVHISSVAYFVDKLMTLAVFTVVGWYGCTSLLPELKWIWFGLFTGLLLVLPVALFLFRYSVFKFKLFYRLQQRVEAVVSDLQRLRSRWYLLLINLVLTVVKWLVVSCVFWIAFRSFNTPVKWPYIGFIPILSTLVGYIPVSIAGVGTVEITAVFLFEKIGIFKPVVLSAYILLRVLQFLIAAFLMALFSKAASDKNEN